MHLRWKASESGDVASYRVYHNGGTGTVNYEAMADEVEAAPGGLKLEEVEWRSGELEDGRWRFGVRAADAAGNEAVSPARETGEIEVMGLPLAVVEVTGKYNAASAGVEVSWTGSASFN